MDTKWQPKTGRYACESNDYCVEIDIILNIFVAEILNDRSGMEVSLKIDNALYLSD